MPLRRISVRIAATAVAVCAALVVPAVSLAQAGGPSVSRAVVAGVAGRETAAAGDLGVHAGVVAGMVAAGHHGSRHGHPSQRPGAKGPRPGAKGPRPGAKGGRSVVRTATLTTGVKAPGRYRVSITLTARNHRVRLVHVLIGPLWRTLRIGASHRAVVRVALNIRGRTLTVLARAVKIKPRMTIRLASGASTPPKHHRPATTPAVTTVAPPLTAAVTPASTVPAGEPSAINMPAIPGGWHSVFSDNFDTPTAFGTNPPGWYSPYSDGTGDTSNRSGVGNGVWLNSQSVMVGPGASGDGSQVPAGVLDIWQHVASGVPISAVLIPDQPDYNANQGLTSECVAFVFRVINPAPGWKMVPLLWDDPTQPAGITATGSEEIDSPEIEFTPNTVTTALHFPNANYVVPYYGQTDNIFNYSLVTGSYGINLNNWTEWQTCRTPGQLTVNVDGQTVFTATNGETFNQWGQTTTVTVPDTSMHWVLQTETSTLTNNQPTPNSADHIQFDWVQITTPNN